MTLPGASGIARPQPQAQQFMVGACIPHLVQSPSCGIKQNRLRSVAIGLSRSRLHGLPADFDAVACQMICIRSGGFGVVSQGRICGPQVLIRARLGLVGHGVRGQLVARGAV